MVGLELEVLVAAAAVIAVALVVLRQQRRRRQAEILAIKDDNGPIVTAVDVPPLGNFPTAEDALDLVMTPVEPAEAAPKKKRAVRKKTVKKKVVRKRDA